MSKNPEIDVLVVGGGTAAFEAAVSARQAGAEKVLILEKAPEDEFGGNARFSHTGFRFVHSGAREMREFLPHLDEATFQALSPLPYRPEDFMKDLDRVTRGRIDKELAAALAHNSNRALHWMLDLGIRFELDAQSYAVIDGRYFFEPGRGLQTAGGGLGQLLQWREIAQRMEIEIRYESKVSALHGNERRIEGVRVCAPGREYDVQAKSVILCSGGFQASAEMRARYLGANADLMKVRGSKHDTGEVLQMALAIGARSAGHWQGAHATPIDTHFPDVEVSNNANRYSYMFGITVNTLGTRFFDEGEAEHSYTYAKTGWTVLGQPGGIAYQIFDQKGLPLLIANRYVHAQPTEAGTIAGLAAELGLEPTVLQHTVEEFNRAVQDDLPFDAAKPDGRSTVGITPKKSNWAMKIDKPPFRAYPVTCGITFTFGGVQIDASGRVLNTGGRPIQGLYASGDIMGLFFHNYPSCSGQTRNLVFGMIAGRSAAAAMRGPVTTSSA
jgi:tricarballylate dehydrogenase